MGVLDSLVTGIRVDTAWGPTINLDQPFAETPEPNPFLQLLKPKITVALTTGSPVSIAPYGDPGDTLWPVVEFVAALGALALVYLVARRVL